MSSQDSPTEEAPEVTGDNTEMSPGDRALLAEIRANGSKVDAYVRNRQGFGHPDPGPYPFR